MNKITKFISVFAIFFSITVIPNIGDKENQQGPNCIHFGVSMRQNKRDHIHFGVSMRQNKRDHMEDRAFRYCFEDGSVMFGVCDGHTGEKAAEYASQHIPENYQNSTEERTEDRLIETFEKTDKDFLEQEIPSGSTIVVGLFRKEDGKQVLYTANTGDSRLVWCRKVDGKVFFKETTDHKPSDPLEEKRIKDAGGFVETRGVPRVFGRLAVSRAIGDREIKAIKPGCVIAKPDVMRFEIEKDDYIILASDGVWDVINSKQAAEQVLGIKDIEIRKKKVNIVKRLKRMTNSFINRVKSMWEVSCEAGNDKKLASSAKELRDAAVARGSRDNITVLIVSFNYCRDKSSEYHEKFHSGSNLFYYINNNFS